MHTSFFLSNSCARQCDYPLAVQTVALLRALAEIERTLIILISTVESGFGLANSLLLRRHYRALRFVWHAYTCVHANALI